VTNPTSHCFSPRTLHYACPVLCRCLVCCLLVWTELFASAGRPHRGSHRCPWCSTRGPHDASFRSLLRRRQPLPLHRKDHCVLVSTIRPTRSFAAHSSESRVIAWTTSPVDPLHVQSQQILLLLTAEVIERAWNIYRRHGRGRPAPSAARTFYLLALWNQSCFFTSAW